MKYVNPNPSWNCRQWEQRDPAGLIHMKEQAPEEYKRLFEEYYHSEASAPVGTGTGTDTGISKATSKPVFGTPKEDLNLRIPTEFESGNKVGIYLISETTSTDVCRAYWGLSGYTEEKGHTSGSITVTWDYKPKNKYGGVNVSKSRETWFCLYNIVINDFCGDAISVKIIMPWVNDIASVFQTEEFYQVMKHLSTQL